MTERDVSLAALQALSSLEFAARDDGPPTLGINKQLLRQFLEPIRAYTELRQAQAGGVLADSLRNLHCELKGAQLMIFEADTPEKRSAAFNCVGNVVKWLMDAERELATPGKQAQAQAQAQAQDGGWVAVEDSLPDEGVPIWAAFVSRLTAFAAEREGDWIETLHCKSTVPLDQLYAWKHRYVEPTPLLPTPQKSTP